MNQLFKINTDLDIPIYRQLVDAICNAIKTGDFPAGHQLPTVFEMTEILGVARGTVKRAYDELERLGLIDKTQGRGTFVKYQPANSASRKEQAMAAIDNMLQSLEDMGFSTAEINIFLNLKLRERSEQEAHVKVAVVECNSENLSQMSEQLRHIGNVDLYSFLLEDVKAYPYKLSDDFDLVVTTSGHSEYLESVLPVKKRLARVALRPSAVCLSHIIKLRPGTKVGVLGYSRRFSKLLHGTAKTYADDIDLDEPMHLGKEDQLLSYIQDKEVLLIPKSYRKLFGSEISAMLKNFKGELIECCYEMDEGSQLYLEAKIKRLLEAKTI